VLLDVLLKQLLLLALDLFVVEGATLGLKLGLRLLSTFHFEYFNYGVEHLSCKNSSLSPGSATSLLCEVLAPLLRKSRQIVPEAT
jgi:hypothetical protein